MIDARANLIALAAVLCLALAIVLCLALAAVPGSAAAGTAPAHPRTSLLSVEDGLICVACHEPLALANSPEAVVERQLAEHLIAKGETKQQILQEEVSQFGTAVLAKPPASGFNLTVYILPPALVIGGALLLAFTLPKWRRRGRAAARTPLPTGPALSGSDARRLEEDLAAWD